MASANPQHEPTMEEILASIRKIISEDSSEAAAPKQDADVLELTQEVREEPAPVAPPVAAPQPAPQPISSFSAPPEPEAEAQPPEEDIVFVPKEEEPTLSNPAHAEAPEHEGIFSEKARKAIGAAFDKIGTEEPPQEAAAQPPGPSAEGNSVEAVFERAVRSGMEPAIREWMDTHRADLLTAVKPLIREWMDEHFPALLEGAIRDEVARVVKARGRR